MIRYILFLCLSLFLSETISAQQLPIFTQYREHIALINPGSVNADFTGFSFRPNSSAGLSYRYQWTNLDDAPSTMTGRYEHILEDQNMLLGATLIRDKAGPTGTTGGYLRYAYQIEFSRYSFLSVGVSAGFLQYQFKGTQTLLRDPDDYIGLADYYANYSEITVGAFYQSELENDDIFYAGLSVPQFLSIPIGSNGKESEYERKPHVYGQAGLYKYLSDGIGSLDGSLYIEPSVWLKYVAKSPIQMDMNLRFQMADLFWVGGGYSVSFLEKIQGNNFHFEVGFSAGTINDKALKIGYGFDKSITPYGINFGSAHEINLTYSFLR